MELIWKLLTLLENETSAAAQLENEERTADDNSNIFDGPVQNITKLVAFQQKKEWHTMFFAKILHSFGAHLVPKPFK